MLRTRNLAALALAAIMGVGLIAWASGDSGHDFETQYSPSKHAVVVAFQCDDRVDSQFVNVALAHGVTISFAPYRDGATQIIDIDSTDFNNSGTATKGEYNEWLNRWAYQLGMPMATHAQHQSPTVWGTYGEAGLDSVFDFESAYIQQTTGMSGHPLGHVWTGHINSAQTRAYAREHGYTYTRGNLPKDLYLSNGGWLSEDGGFPFPPMCMTHRAVVPSISMYRLTEPMADDSLYQTSTAADTTHLWTGTLNFLNTMAEHNGFGVLNIHPGWGIPHSETVADTMFTTWVDIPDTYGGDPDSIMFNNRKGVTGRNDVSAYQLDYILHAMAWWDDSVFAADGVRRLCIANIDELMQDPSANWRNDNSTDWTAVSDWWSGGSAGSLNQDYWTSSTGLYAKDPELNTSRTVYIDGSGEVKAGNGTAQYPLPATAITHVFNSKVVYTGHAAGDTLILPRARWRTANVDVDFAGLRLLPATTDRAVVRMDTTSSNVYLHNITLRNGIIDGKASTNTQAQLYIGNGTGTIDSLRTTGVTLKGIRFVNGEAPAYLLNCRDVVIDSCFFAPGSGSITDNGATWALQIGQYSKNTLVRNSVFDMADCGGGSGSSPGSGVSGAIQLLAHSQDSVRVINNVFYLGNAADTDDYQAALRTPATNSSLKLRWAGNYISSGVNSAENVKPWLNTTGYLSRSIAALADTLALYQSGVYVGVKNYLATGYGIGGYDYLSDASDTTRFGGYTGAGSHQTGIYASIGPSQFGYAPLLWTSGAVQGRPSTATLAGPWEALSLVNNGVLSASTATDPDTWFEIPRIYDESSLAVARGFLDAWEKWPSAAQAKVRFKVSGEPVTVITSADSTYQTLGQLDAALTAAAETASDSLVASTWFTLPRPYNLNAAFQIEIIRAWWRSLAEANRKKIRFRVSGTDYSMAMPDTAYSNGLWAVSKAISTGAETASDSLDASTWFSLPRVYDMAQAQQAGVFMDAWEMWPDAKRKQIRMKTK